MLDAKEMEARFLKANPNSSLRKIRRLKSKRNKAPGYLNVALSRIRSRCVNPNGKAARYYHDKGIECRLTLADLRYLWNRDGAASMDRPSVDRINAHGHYELDNCRIVEQSLNASRGLVDQWLRRPEGVIVEVLPAHCASCAPVVTPA